MQNSTFTLPSNIKQMGSIGTGLRIYMEDYVCTFLNQYATTGGYEERIAYLVGRQMLIDGQEFLFISGAIYGMYAEQMEGYLRFSQASADYAQDMLDEHFPGQEIVGWMQSQPSYGTYLNQNYANYHLRQFPKSHQVLFVMDPLERATAFYTINPNAITPQDRLIDNGGYFIYYEKNVNMHEYMLTNKTLDQSPHAFAPLTHVEPVMAEDEAHEDEDHILFTSQPRSMESLESMEDEAEDPEETIRRHIAKNTRKKTARAEHRRSTSSLLGGLCAVLFVVAFVMGVSLIRNQDRIDRMEGEIRQLVTAHRNLFASISNMPSHELAPVFAETVTENFAEPVVAEPVATAPLSQQEAQDELLQQQLLQQQLEQYQLEQYLLQQQQLLQQYQAERQLEQQLIAAASNQNHTPYDMLPTRPGYSGEAEALHVPPIDYSQYTTGIIHPLPTTYTIQPGDSLLAISLRFFGTSNMVDAILAINGIEDPNHIVVGREIELPRP